MRKRSPITFVELLLFVAFTWLLIDGLHGMYTDYVELQRGKQISNPVIEFQQVK